VAALACYLRLAGTQAVNSDGAAQALQAWDMLHGNLLLHGWTVSDVSFYTTELPEYALVDFFRGLTPDVVHVAAAITYTLVVLLAALLAKSTATGRAALVRVLVTVGIMVVPQLPQGINILISSPDHIGTSAPILVTWLILDRARSRRWVPVAVTVALGWAAVADQLVLIVGVLPLVFVCLVRVIKALGVERQELRAQRYDLALGAGALAGGGAAWLALRLLSAAGGFGLQPVAAHLDSNLADLPSHFAIAGQGLLLLGGADLIGQPPGVGAVALALHLVGVGLAALAVAVAATQFLHGRDRVNQVLVAGVAFNLAAYAFSTRAIQIRDVREMAPVLPLSAVLAGRLLADRIRVSKVAMPALSVVLLGYLAGLGYELTSPQVPAQNEQIAFWLEAHHFRSGLSGYWQGNVIALTTGVRVRVAPMMGRDDGFVPIYWDTKPTWYDARQSSANFVLIGPTFPNVKGAVTTFGQPAHVYRVGPYEVLTYSKNLLTDLGRPLAEDAYRPFWQRDGTGSSRGRAQNPDWASAPGFRSSAGRRTVTSSTPLLITAVTVP
jgi:hypothetical protein